jgi:pimeloyl-ACP methyl ester carboxylesterase
MADPTIVLVHGAFADASGFRGLYDELLGEDATIIAPPNPLRGLSGGDGEYLKGVIDEIDGPVLLVAHSYGGSVITAAGTAPTPAWRSRPVWAVLPTADRCIDPGVHRFSYDRMGANVTEIEGASHVVMISHPKEVAEVVMTAVRTFATEA